MKNRAFVDQVIDLYGEARKTKFPGPGNIKRARSHTISSETEDLMAKFISEIIPEAFIVIDKRFSFCLEEGKKARSFYPDITVRKSGKIATFFDVKMDLGWKRTGFLDYCKAKGALVKKLRGQPHTLFGEPIIFSQDLKYEIIVISDQNGMTSKIPEIEKSIREAGIQEDVPLYFLSGGHHPNGGKSEVAKEKIVIHDDAFERLRKRVQSL